MLFEYSRCNLSFIDKPHVSIKVWSWCPAWCLNCDFSYKKIKSDITYSKESIFKNIEKASQIFSENFDIFIVGIDILKSDILEDIILKCQKNSRTFKLQINHTISDLELLFIKRLSEKFWTFDCSIPIMIESSNDLILIVKLLKRVQNISIWWKLYFDIFLDISKYDTIITSIISKFSTHKSENSYNCIIWNLFDLKFHDLWWDLDHKNKMVSWLKRSKCMMKDYFSFKNESIYLVDHIEIFPNWDLVFHDNLCYLGNYKISNVYRTHEQIIFDFKAYRSYLDKINSTSSQAKNCYNCIKNPFIFNDIKYV